MRLIFLLGIYCLFLNRTLGLPFLDYNQQISDKKNINQELKILDSLIHIKRMKNPNEALSLAKSAYILSKQSADKYDIIKGYTLLGYAYYDTKKDSSYLYYSRALTLADSMGDQNMKAHLYYNIAMIYGFVYNYNQALIYLDSSAKTG